MVGEWIQSQQNQREQEGGVKGRMTFKKLVYRKRQNVGECGKCSKKKGDIYV
jgi:hypothetical protein